MSTKTRRRFNRKIALRDSKKGVSATVGTIMALLIFLAFLSMFMTQWVPIWMTDSEAAYTFEVQTDFASLKSNIDLAVIAALGTGQKNYTLYSPIKMASGAVPIFAEPTRGNLMFLPEEGKFNITYELKQFPGGPPTLFTSNGSGILRMEIPNRYYVRQNLFYENGAIIVHQSAKQQIIKSDPQIDVLVTQGASGSKLLTLKIGLYQLVGQSNSKTGEGSEGVYISVLYAKQSSIPRTNVMLTVTTPNVNAWFEFFNKTMTSKGLSNNREYTITQLTNGVRLTFSSLYINELILTESFINIALGSSVSR